MTELVLVNIDFSFDYPQVLPPNVVAVGGLQVNRTEQPDQVLHSHLARGMFRKCVKGDVFCISR